VKIERVENREYQQQLKIKRLRQAVFAKNSSASSDEMKSLIEAEKALVILEKKRLNREDKNSNRGVVLEKKFQSSNTKNGVTRSIGTTNQTEVNIKVNVVMETLPTAIYHLFDAENSPLVVCEIQVASLAKGKTKRIRVVSFIEGYSAKSINTIEITENKMEIVTQLPTLFPNAIKDITELTKATLNVMVEELDSDKKIESTYTISLLARNSAITYGINNIEEELIKLDEYLGVFVTPNQQDIIRFLHTVSKFHPNQLLGGYQGQMEGDETNESGKESVRRQVKAIFEALKDLDLIYVNSIIDFNPDRNIGGQRVRLPKESLNEKQANCLDGTLLYASLMEACSLNPAIVLIEGHAFVAWESWYDNDEWNYLETTMTSKFSFEEACFQGEGTAKAHLEEEMLTLLPINKLRGMGLMPME